MLKLFHDATWLLAMTLSVRPAYASVTPAPPCDALHQVRFAPTASARVGAEGGDQRIARSAGPPTDLDFQCQSADERRREGRRRDHGWQEVEPRRAADVGGIGDLKPGPPGCRGGRGLVRAAQGEDARHERGTYRQRSHGTLLSSMRERPQGAAVSESGGTGGYRRRGRGPGRAAAAVPEEAGPRFPSGKLGITRCGPTFTVLPKLPSLDLAVHTRTGRAGLLEYRVEEHAVFKELGEARDGQRSSERPRWHHHWHHGYNPACPSSGPR